MSERRDNPFDRPYTPSPYDRDDVETRQQPYDPATEDVYQQEIEETENADDSD
ncbi:MAG TPA: hypothetical protein VKC61_14670 [Pyrinomonadaceae bacterium]|nr:hypothetical protein [Pyrinomonadaceae bacterium]